MPVILLPLHFDRDPVDRKPSAQRSIVLRPFVTNDFMTGVPVIPGSEKLPMNVSERLALRNVKYSEFFPTSGYREDGDRDSTQRTGHFARSL